MAKYYFYLFLLLILGLILQIIIINNFSVLGAGPQIVLIEVLYIALNKGCFFGEIYGFLGGMLVDIFTISVFGTNAFMFTILSYLTGILMRKVDENNFIIQFLIVFFATLLLSFSNFVISSIFIESNSFDFKHFIIAPVYSGLISPAIFYIMRWFTERIDRLSGVVEK